MNKYRQKIKELEKEIKERDELIKKLAEQLEEGIKLIKILR